MAVRKTRRSRAGPTWTETFDRLTAAAEDSLGADEFEQLAVAAFLTGHDLESEHAWEAAYRDHLAVDRPAEAARCSFWLALGLMLRGQMAQAGGWLGRTEATIEDAPDCAAAGYLLIPAMLRSLEDDPDAAVELAARATEIGRRHGDADLVALGTLGQGQAQIALGAPGDGLASLDHAMVSVTAGEVGPVTTGLVYCAVILECMELFDLARATEWTGALDAWCRSHQDLVPYRGQCLVHRSQLQQAAGDWSDAIETSDEACERLSEPPHPALGLAWYQNAELHRLVGDFEQAEDAYRRASECAHEPMPGLALLELARGHHDEAAASIARTLHDTAPTTARPALLAAAVDIGRAVGNIATVRSAADELTEAGRGSAVLAAMAARAQGTALLVEDDPSGGIAHLRSAAQGWQSLRMPYELARTNVLLGLSCAALGDVPAARLEFENAAGRFAALGAAPDLHLLDDLRRRVGAATGPGASSALTGRELEVLRLVAAGQTNRDVAAELSISPHTVRRHLENIFAKLGVTTRAAATAHAYENQLL